MKIGIFTDSTADLPAWFLEEYNFQIVPIILVLEGKEYADGIVITRAEFYNRLSVLRPPPATAAPSIGDFAAPYEILFPKGCGYVVSI